MLKYIIKRLAYSVLILLGVSIIIYFLIRLMPVDYIQTKVNALSNSGGTIDQDKVDAMYKQYGLIDTTGMAFGEKMMSYLQGYWGWLSSMLHGDLGVSFKYAQPVTAVIGDYMWLSFAVALIATVFEFLIAIPLGITASTISTACVTTWSPCWL